MINISNIYDFYVVKAYRAQWHTYNNTKKITAHWFNNFSNNNFGSYTASNKMKKFLSKYEISDYNFIKILIYGNN
jgi:hypothetical protein